jgi:hypothetical protein
VGNLEERVVAVIGARRILGAGARGQAHESGDRHCGDACLRRMLHGLLPPKVAQRGSALARRRFGAIGSRRFLVGKLGEFVARAT